MDLGHLQIAIDSNDASWKQRCIDKMRKLKNTQFPCEDAASQLGLTEHVLHESIMISELYKAIEDGNVDNFVDVLGQVCERRKVPLCDIFDEVTVTGDSLLHVAANLGKERIMELICDQFPKLLIKGNVRGDTALHDAVRSKNSTMINLILSNIEKAKHYGMKDITREKNENGDTPLHEAVKSKNPEVVKVILDATDKDVVHCLNKSKRSPLFLAVVSENVEILNLLLEIPLPADKPLPQCFGNSPLHAAILQRNSDLINEILLKKPDLIYLKDEDENNSLHYATYIGYVEGCHVLLKAPLEKLHNTTLEWNKKGCRPIHFVCKRGDIGMIEKFFQHEWSFNSSVNQKGQNILHVAAKNGRYDLVKYLLRHPKMDEFTLNQQDNDGNTPLHLASKNIFPNVMLLMFKEKRVNANLLNNNSLTAGDTILVSESQETFRKSLTSHVVKRDGFPITINRMRLHPEHRETNNFMTIKDMISTYLVVGTLMVTVTFAAGFTVPGGLYSSDDPNPKNRGMAILADKPNFRAFTIFNSIGMYSSVTAVALLLWGIAARSGDRNLAIGATAMAGVFLFLAFLAVQLAFMSATRLVLEKNSTLSISVLLIGLLYCLFATLYGLLGFCPCFQSASCLADGYFSEYTVLNFDEKAKGSSSHKANKNHKLEAHAS